MPLFEGIGYSGEKTAVIFDIGAIYTKCGFGGEFSPRCIIPSKITLQKTGKEVVLRDVQDEDELHDVLVEFLQYLYFRHLLVNPKERRVVLCESLLCPALFRNTMARVFFKHFEVPSVLFAPAHQMVLFTLGSNSGLVVDCGYTETLVVPFYEGIPLMNAWEALPLAGKAIHQRLQSQLLKEGKVKTSSGGTVALSTIQDSLPEETLENIKGEYDGKGARPISFASFSHPAACCFFTKIERADQIVRAQLYKDSGYSIDGNEVKPPVPPPAVEFPMDGEKILQISGEIRESTCEALYEMNRDDKCLATLILDSILKCPIDLRKYFAENIIVIGGTAMLPGFMPRLKAELHNMLSLPQYKQNLCLDQFKFHKLPAKENYAAWLGSAMFGALEVLPTRSLSRDLYNQQGRIPDWASLAEQLELDKDDRLPRR